MSTTDAVFNKGVSVMTRIATASKALGINPQKSAERYLCEEISRGMSAVMKVRHIIKGGCIYLQPTRETRDLDITFARKIADVEFYRAIRDMASMLAEKGIVITQVSKPAPLWINGDDGMRFEIEAKIGTAKIKTHVDVTGGSRQLPLNTPSRSVGSTFFAGQVPLHGFFQSFESQVADKLASVALRPDTIRWKDFTDLSMLSKMDLDKTIIAAELAYKLSFQFSTEEDVLAALPEIPATMSFEYVEEKGRVWKAWNERNGRKVSADFTDVACDCRNFYHDIRQILVAKARVDRKPRLRSRPAQQSYALQQIRQEVRENKGNVIQMGDYRDPQTLAFKPKW
ncbi:nucleotidyl transferase AbiEii/AbiGii toxin family protein [Rhizobium sp. NZLR4b]|uniref:nucleotidyl transferase AbiEii/AbiGii toxin family protein n=1 Tax=Rhizobium sp. NZLR4b TaxID=2731102 RepID=UPI001C84081F|nr:nucleotidyl transferase AbiEii/AbiGii toxin family protein [Rhizobium sp. NZLR4b]MBX5164775.1 nucleotidyl transferase AbiEii/AbiGii toxin family protein [Rhizobium sp. NZLR4b]